jgi:hypothetical protein
MSESWHEWGAERPVADYTRDDGVRFRPGDRVRLRPCGRADIFDMALEGRTAVLATIEQDFEGRFFFTVTVDDDPGRDLGGTGQPGHRFFFRPDEVELLAAGQG